MLTKKMKSYLPILVLLFLFGGVYLGYANMWLCVVTFVITLTKLNKSEFIFVMLMAGGEYFGAVARATSGHFTVIPQFIIYVIVLFLLYERINTLFRQNRTINYLFFFLLMVFFVSYLYGPQHAYSNMKLIRIILLGLLCLWSFSVYNSEREIDPTKIAYLFAIVGITYIVMGVTVYHFGTPSSFLDFGYFGRHSQVGTYDDFAISYHSVGLPAMYGVAFLLSPTDDKFILKTKSILLLFILLFIALVSQMRQGILAIFVLLFFRYVLLMRGRIGYKIIGLLLVTAILAFVFTKVQTEAFGKVENAQSFEEAVNRPYDKTLSIIEEYPVFGLGLGGYSDDGERSYPHNIFLEIINETGFFGLAIIVFISLYAMRYNRFSWKMINANGTYAILLLLAVFVRVNASADLAENIYFFSLLYSMKNRPSVH